MTEAVAFTPVSRATTPRQQVAALVAAGGVQLVDVRQPHEHEAGHIAGSRLIELTELPAQAATIDENVPVIFYCRSGGRSAMAAEALLPGGLRRPQHDRRHARMAGRRPPAGAGRRPLALP